MQGEIFLDQDPYTVVQPGYSHAWNAHGGAAHLHEHLVTHYAACWQQSLSNGEWDPSVCDIGVSRLFNYYVEVSGSEGPSIRPSRALAVNHGTLLSVI